MFYCTHKSLEDGFYCYCVLIQVIRGSPLKTGLLLLCINTGDSWTKSFTVYTSPLKTGLLLLCINTGDSWTKSFTSDL